MLLHLKSSSGKFQEKSNLKIESILQVYLYLWILFLSIAFDFTTNRKISSEYYQSTKRTFYSWTHQSFCLDHWSAFPEISL